MNQNEGHAGNQPAESDEKSLVVEEIIVIEEFIDLEEYAKKKKHPVRAKRYRIRIDKEYFEVTEHEMTGRQILALVHKTPETYLLSEKLQGGQVLPITADQVVEFHKHCVERFQTLKLEPTEGGCGAA
jgi:hypothetical protein